MEAERGPSAEHLHRGREQRPAGHGRAPRVDRADRPGGRRDQREGEPERCGGADAAGAEHEPDPDQADDQPRRAHPAHALDAAEVGQGDHPQGHGGDQHRDDPRGDVQLREGEHPIASGDEEHLPMTSAERQCAARSHGLGRGRRSRGRWGRGARPRSGTEPPPWRAEGRCRSPAGSRGRWIPRSGRRPQRRRRAGAQGGLGVSTVTHQRGWGQGNLRRTSATLGGRSTPSASWGSGRGAPATRRRGTSPAQTGRWWSATGSSGGPLADLGGAFGQVHGDDGRDLDLLGAGLAHLRPPARDAVLDHSHQRGAALLGIGDGPGPPPHHDAAGVHRVAERRAGQAPGRRRRA